MKDTFYGQEQPALGKKTLQTYVLALNFKTPRRQGKGRILTLERIIQLKSLVDTQSI